MQALYSPILCQLYINHGLKYGSMIRFGPTLTEKLTESIKLATLARRREGSVGVFMKIIGSGLNRSIWFLPLMFVSLGVLAQEATEESAQEILVQGSRLPVELQ